MLLHWNSYCQYARSTLKLLCQFNQLHWKQKKEIEQLFPHPTTVNLVSVCQWTSVCNEDFVLQVRSATRSSTITTGKRWFIQVPLIRFALFYQVMCRYRRDTDLEGRQTVHLIFGYKSLQQNNNDTESNCLIPNGVSKNKSWFINIHLIFKSH